MSNIYLFNSGHEQEVLYNTPSYTLPERSTKITTDFQQLPLWYAEPYGLVLVYDSVSEDFRESLVRIGFQLPKLIIYSSLASLQLNNDIFNIIPWGLSAAVITRIEKEITIENSNLKLPIYDIDLLNINSRLFSIDILKQIKAKNELPDGIEIPQIFDDFDKLATFIASHSTSKILIKSPYSSSGIGLLWIRDGLQRSETQILKGFLRRQGAVVVEKVYNKVLDFALEYTYCDDSFVFRGISLFSTNHKGAYQGNILSSQNLITLYLCKYIAMDTLDAVKALYVDLLNKNCKNRGLTCIGIDMMIIEIDGQYVIHPCVEINPRYNMGYLAVEFFERHVVDSSIGSFQVLYDDTDRLISFVEKQQSQYPLQMQGSKLRNGFLAMTPILSDTKYLLYATIVEEGDIENFIF